MVQRKIVWRTMTLLLLFACGEPRTLEPIMPEGPGFLAVQLDTPNTDDGAVWFTLSGGPMDSVRVSQKTLLTREGVAGQRSVIVVGVISDGTVASFWVPERRDVANYQAVLEQATGLAAYEQKDITNYTLTIEVQ